MVSKSIFEEVLGGSAISKSNPKNSKSPEIGFFEEVSSESVVSKWTTRLAFKILNSSPEISKMWFSLETSSKTHSQLDFETLGFEFENAVSRET